MTAPDPTLPAVVTAGASALLAGGGWLGHILSSRSQRRAAIIQAQANTNVAENKLIDQLQEELTRYREANDKRVEKLEGRVESLTEENRRYRAYIGEQRDHMASHGIPLLPWPADLPR